MLFNVNNYMKVKLTDLGVEVLKKQHEELYEMLPEEAQKPFKLKLTEDGWYRDQAWSLMKKFGPYIQMGMNAPFETEIDIEC